MEGHLEIYSYGHVRQPRVYQYGKKNHFGFGDGISGDPYQVATPAHLISIA